MTDTAPAVAAPKVKKAAVKPKKPASHPTYSEMIAAALFKLSLLKVSCVMLMCWSVAKHDCT